MSAMNLNHLLSWSSASSSSLPSPLQQRLGTLKAPELASDFTVVCRDFNGKAWRSSEYNCGTSNPLSTRPEQKNGSNFTVACRDSNGKARRSSEYSSSTSNGLSICPRGPAEQTNGSSFTVVCRDSNGKAWRSSEHNSSTSNALSTRPGGQAEQKNGSSYRNSEGSEGSRENSGRYGGHSKAGQRDSRYGGGSERRHGGRNAGGRGGGRRDRKKQMHPGAYTMRDEQTGEMVVVWGVEDDDDIPMPTSADLNWRKATAAFPGEVSEETWAKAMAGQAGSVGSYSVRGVEQGENDWTDNRFEGDSEDDFEDDGILDDEDDSDYDSEEIIETPRVSISRAPKVRVFGRDMWGKSQVKVKTPEMVENNVLLGPALDSEARQTSSTQGVVDGHTNDPITEANLSGVVAFPPNGVAEQESPALQNGAGDARSLAFKPDGTVEEERSRVPEINLEFMEKSVASKVDGKSSEWPNVAELDDNFRGKRREVPTVEDQSRGRSMAPKNEDDFAVERRMPARGSFNPYIVDVSEEGGSHSHTNQNEDVRKSGLLDRLRVQVTGNIPRSQGASQKVVHDRIEAAPYSTASWNVGGGPPDTPVRDPTARDNFDASIVNDFFSLKSFKNVGATSEVIQALSYLHVQRPSQIQAMAFKPILEGKSCIIAEQTGSGKTLAYVAPVVQRLKADEVQTLGKSLSKQPRVLVLVPTGELAAQVLSTFRAISKAGVPCRSIAITGGFKWKTQVESLEGGADVVVATPGRLLQQLKAGNIQFDNLKSVIFDEVDILFDDEEFSQALETINKTASIKAQYIHVTATLPVDIHDDLLERYPDCMSVMGPNLHRTAVGLQEVLVDCSGGEADEKTPESAFINKRTALIQLVEERPVAKTIVFCNKMETCRKVENVLSRYDRSGKKINVLPYHAALSQEARLENLETFMKSKTKERLFLVCTDRASRGIDSLDVEHVVLFDFPRDPSEYVRRVGRTARGAGGTGKVFVFVVGRQVGLARRIMARNDKGEPVHDVPGSRYYYTN